MSRPGPIGGNLAAIVVSYQPDFAALAGLCARLQSAGASVIVVDNSNPSIAGKFAPDHGVQLVCMDENKGIAQAQNAGIDRALADNADAILLLDQDSQVNPEMIPALMEAVSGSQPQIVGPVIIDEADGVTEMPALVLDDHGRARPVFGADREAPFPVDVIIASGTMATAAVFAKVGRMDESLFIDYVDTEWCLRCRAAGIAIRIVPAARMLHRIGDRRMRVLGRTLFWHAPVRCYYQIRNILLLLRRTYWPKRYGLRQVGALLASRAILMLYSDRRPAYLKAIAFGVWDGLAGKTGKADFEA